MHHYHRAYGRSQFFNVRRIARTIADVMRLWFLLVVSGPDRLPPAAPDPDPERAAGEERGS